MSEVGMPLEGLKTVGQIVGTNTLTFRTEQNVVANAGAKENRHSSALPVRNRRARQTNTEMCL
jgi:hypothetical protein